MSLVDLLSSYICVVICTLGICVCYKEISNKRIKFLNIKSLIIIFIYSTIQMIISLTQYNLSRMFIALAMIFLVFRNIFKENFELTFIKTLIIHILGLIMEIVYSFAISLLGNNIMMFDQFILIKNLVSILIILSIYFVIKIKYSKLIIERLISLIINKKSKLVKSILILFYIFITIQLFLNMTGLSDQSYFENNMFLIFALIIMGLLIFDHYKYIKSEENKKTLLEFMTTYEKLIDKNRINKHEMLNNLIILSTYKDKNSKSFQNTLNEMIESYSFEKNKTFRNIGSMPIGMKGIFYYKIGEIEINNLDFIFHCSDEVNDYLIDTSNKDYNKCSKLLGIFIDNAIEAAKDSEERKLIVDIYLENNYLNFYIENSTKNNPNIHMLRNKNYSTKGSGRGLGLFIANKMRLQSKTIKYKQYMNSNNNFVTELKIKVK